MLVIRFQRTGRRNIPSFRLVAAEKSRAAKGKVVEYLGHYLPARDPHVFEFDKERIGHWLKMGAQPSDTAARLLAKAGMPNVEKYIVRYTKKKPKNEATEGAGESAPPAAKKEEGAATVASPKKEEEGDAKVDDKEAKAE